MQGRAQGSSLSERPEVVPLISRDQTRRAGTTIVNQFAGRECEMSGKGSPQSYGWMIYGDDILTPPEESSRVEWLGKAVSALPIRGDVDHTYPLMIVIVTDVMDLVVEMLIARRDPGVLADRDRRRVVHPHA